VNTVKIDVNLKWSLKADGGEIVDNYEVK